ncbi:MAG: BrnT family toxin [Bdellovibrionaceae bacterium]|nr:BrnT family toxin [Pseudobdellovibrionaceae bacterium]
MVITWDPIKATINIKKHGISFEVAATVFNDPHQLSLLDSKGHGEERWVTIGLAADKKTIVVVHTYMDSESGEFIRIISARKATKKERQNYEEGI